MDNLPLLPKPEDAAEPIMLSALQHYLYCPRQCALIHLDHEFAENVHTMRGNAVHAQVDIPESELRDKVRIERALPLFSQTLGVIGKADVVEFHGDVPYPIEYKHGSRHTKLADDVQVAAQGMCLEDMLGVSVPEGAIYHYRSRRRRVVPITSALRETVKQTIASVREMLATNKLPPPVNDARCDECSLRDICQPQPVAQSRKLYALATSLYEVGEENDVG
jgi:CRISPR-associated exonuclease Cas4